jgi:site-specific DNA recombinase
VTQAAVYLRISQDHTGEGLAVARQREDAQRLAKDRGWTVAKEYVDNSISASDSRKVRPGYDELCRDFEAGLWHALIVYDLDRLTRQPRQLEDWIDAAEVRGLQLVTTNGEADLTTDGGRLFARIKLAVARGEVERKSARQVRAHLQRAERGKPAKGIRPTGYALDGSIITAEAKIVRRIFDQFAAGGTLKGIAAGLNDDGIPTRRGGAWSSSSVGTILRNARYTGRSIYKGTDVGAATWKAIISEAQFAAVQARLDDPRRKTRGPDTARKHLGSGLYFCKCGNRVRSSSGMGNGRNRYTCRSFCFYRSGAPIDDYVERIVRGRLALPDLRNLLTRPVDESRMTELRNERTELRHRLAATEADYDNDVIDGRRYKAKVELIEAKLTAIQTEEGKLMAQAGPGSVLAAEDPVAAYDAADLAIQQRVIDALAVITLHPARHGSRTFDPDTVTVAWRS